MTTLNTFVVYAAAMNMPAGFTSDNLPVGITFLGRPYSEPTLLKLAYSYEQATHHRSRPRPRRRCPDGGGAAAAGDHFGHSPGVTLVAFAIRAKQALE